MKFKKIAAATMAGAMALSLAACGGSNTASASTAAGAATSEAAADSNTSGEKKLTVTWWGNQTRNERTISTLNLYAEQNPGVTFDPQVAEWADYWNKLATASAGKALPDIIQMDYKYLDQYIKNGLLTDLTPYVEDGTLDVSNIDEGILNTGKGSDGGLYAICIGENAPALVYNKTLLDENGITVKDNMTVDEFKALCKEVYEKTGYKSNYYYNQGENNLEYVLRANDITLFENGKLGAASADDFNQYFGVFEDGIKEGWMLSASSFAERNIGTIEQDPLVYGSDPANRSWCTFLWTNSLSAIQAAAPEGMELGITTWPSDDAKKSNYLKPGQFFCVSSDSKDPVEAAKVIDFFTNSVDANKILLAERGVPASTVVADAIAPDLDAGTQSGMTFIKNVIAPNCSQIMDALAGYSNPTIKYGWQHAQTLPRVITEKNGILYQMPVKEIEQLRMSSFSVEESAKLLLPCELALQNPDNSSFDLMLGTGLHFAFEQNDSVLRLYFTDETGSGRTERKAKVKGVKNVRLWIDTSSVEIFVNDGAVVFSTRFYPDSDKIELYVRADHPCAITGWNLKPITMERGQIYV